MRRELEQLLGGRLWDVVVVGGGVYGASVALSAAERGLKVALVEAGDYAGGASANSLKIIHGGFRYLKDRDIARLRRAARARAWWLERARAVVEPLRSVVELGPWQVPAAAGAAVAYNILTRPWQGEPRSGHRLRATVVGLARARAMAGPIGRSLGGPGLVWYDALARQTQRLVVEMIMAARRLGVVALNYVRAEGLEPGRGETRVVVRDMVEGQRGEIRAGSVVVAAGAGGEKLAGLSPGRWAVGVNLVVARGVVRGAVGVRSPMDDPVCGPRRYIFAVEWGPGAMLGTAYWPVEAPGSSVVPTPAQLERLLEEFRAACPGLEIAPGDVVDYHAGMIPLDERGRLATRRRLEVVREGRGGIVVVCGAKYTTAPVVGAEIAEMVGRWVGAPGKGGGPGQWSLERTGMWGREGQEVARAVREEQARTLEDIVFRRLGLEEMGAVPRGVVERVGQVAAGELGWDESELRRQVEMVMAHYAPVRALWKRAGRMR